MQVVFGLIGAGIGTLAGNPALGWAIGTLVGGALFGQEGMSGGEVGRIGDQRIQGATQGTPIAIVYGRERVAGNIMWATGILETDSQETTGGKKGGVTTTNVTNTTSLAVMICRGNPVARPDVLLRRIWANNEVVYSERPEAPYSEGAPVLSEKLAGSTVTFYPGDESQSPDASIQADKGAANVPAFLGRAYCVHADLTLNRIGNTVPNFAYEVDTGTWDAEEVLLDIVDMVGIAAADCDFSAVASLNVPGFVIPARTEARQAMASLGDMLLFDIVEYDGKLRAILRSGASAYTISYDELAGSEGGSAPSARRVSVSRTQEVELPKEVTTSYHSEAADFQQFSQRADILTRTSDESEQLSFQAVMTDAKARELAEIRLRSRWAERDKLSFVTTYRMIKMVPGDVATIELNEAGTLTKLVKLLRVEGTTPGLIRVDAKSHDPEAYVQDVEAAAVDSEPGEVFVPSTTYFALTEVNAPSDDLADDIWIVAAAGRLDSGWSGGMLTAGDAEGKAPGEQYSRDRAAFTASCTFGVSDGALADGDYHSVDEVSVLTVNMQGGGALTSITRAQLLEGGNPAIIGQEVICFQTATEVSPDVYELTNLRRGLRGTEQMCGSHADGDPFILLNGKEVWINYYSFNIGSTLDFFVFDFGTAASLGTQTTPTLAGRARRPYSPVLLTAERDGGTNDVTLNWVRRARKNGDLMELDDAPLDEDTETYTVAIYNTAGTVWKRNITVTAAQTTEYTSAMQVTDFGAASAFSFKVAQWTPAFDIGDGEYSEFLSVAAP